MMHQGYIDPLVKKQILRSGKEMLYIISQWSLTLQRWRCWPMCCHSVGCPYCSLHSQGLLACSTPHPHGSQPDTERTTRCTHAHRCRCYYLKAYYIKKTSWFYFIVMLAWCCHFSLHRSWDTLFYLKRKNKYLHLSIHLQMSTCLVIALMSFQ